MAIFHYVFHSIIAETIVEPNQKHYPWYHEKFRRVPTIDQCYTDDVVCRHEATMQFKRDKKVDSEILTILRSRFEECVAEHDPDRKVYCQPLYDYYKRAEENWFSKCTYLELNVFQNGFVVFISMNSIILFVAHFVYFSFNKQLDGDLGYYGDSLSCFMKQKHRMIWERRHGKIGSNKKETEDNGWYA